MIFGAISVFWYIALRHRVSVHTAFRDSIVAARSGVGCATKWRNATSRLNCAASKAWKLALTMQIALQWFCIHVGIAAYTHTHTHKHTPGLVALWFVYSLEGWGFQFISGDRTCFENRLAVYLISCEYATLFFDSTLTIESTCLLKLMNISLDNRAINYHAPVSLFYEQPVDTAHIINTSSSAVKTVKYLPRYIQS